MGIFNKRQSKAIDGPVMPPDGPSEIVGPLEVMNRYKDSPVVFSQLVRDGLLYRADFTQKWATYRAAYTLRHNVQLRMRVWNDFVKTGISKSTIDGEFSATSINMPEFDVQPTRYEDIGAAKALKALVKFWWHRFGIHKPLRAGWKDCLMYGNGWWKTTWMQAEKIVKPTQKELEVGLQERVLANDEEAMANGNDLTPLDDIISGFEAEVMNGWGTTTEIDVDKPMVERISPWHVVIDPNATCLEDAEWICHIIRDTVESIRTNDKYKKSVRTKVAPSLSESEEYDGSDDKHAGDPTQDLDNTSRYQRQADVYEMWHVPSKTVSTWAAGNPQEYLIDPAPWPYACGLPFQHARLYEVPDQIYGMGEIEGLLSLEEELDETRTQLLDHKRGLATKTIVRRVVTSIKGNIAALKDRRSNAIIEIPDDSGTIGRPLGEFVAHLQPPRIPGDLYNMTQVIHEDIERASGWSEYSRGVSPSTRRTAKEASIIQSGSETKLSDKHNSIAYAAAGIAEKIILLAQQYMVKEDVVRITGREGFDWMEITPESLLTYGDLEITVKAGSMAHTDIQNRADRAVALMQAFAPFVAENAPGVIKPEAFIAHVMRLLGIEESEQFLMTEQERQLMLDEQMMMAEGMAAAQSAGAIEGEAAAMPELMPGPQPAAQLPLPPAPRM